MKTSLGNVKLSFRLPHLPERRPILNSCHLYYIVTNCHADTNMSTERDFPTSGMSVYDIPFQGGGFVNIIFVLPKKEPRHDSGCHEAHLGCGFQSSYCAVFVSAVVSYHLRLRMKHCLH